MITVNDYNEERYCIYKEEEYLVRDNGALLRKSRPGQRRRKLDDKWTFGTPNENGYLVIGKERAHRIVATAYHGEPSTKEHVVDHIDTNKHNNRPSNLRWITRLENVVLNETTRKRIEYRTGVNIIEFLKNPSLYRDCFDTPDYSWMRRVTEEEAKACLENVTCYAKSSPLQAHTTSAGIGEWIYQSHKAMRVAERYENDMAEPEETDIIDSLTSGAKQVNWRTPSEFLCCPENTENNSIQAYFDRLFEGVAFAKSQHGESIIKKFALVDNQFIVAITAIPSSVKPFALVRITYENGYYLHHNLHSFFEEKGANKYFTLEQGLEWTGGDCFDDYC